MCLAEIIDKAASNVQIDEADKNKVRYYKERFSAFEKIINEVKSSKTISKDDFKHIYHLKENLQSKFDKGIVFYAGDTAMKLDDDMFALPFGFMG